MGNVNSKQQAAIDSLLAGCNHIAAARAAGVTAQSLSRWLHGVDFVAELGRQRAAITNSVQMSIMSKAVAAVETLAELATGAERDSDRIRAAGLIVGLAVGSIADSERESRFAELSARVEAALRQRAA